MAALLIVVGLAACLVAGACAAFAWNARRVGRSALREYEVVGYSGETIQLRDGSTTIEMSRSVVDVDPDEQLDPDERKTHQLARGTRVVAGPGFVAAVDSAAIRANAQRAQEHMTRLAIRIGAAGILLIVAGIFLR